MKKVLIVMAGAILFAFSGQANTKNFNKSFREGTNDTLTVTFKVNGTAACEANIEGAVTAKAGVISANWVPSTKMMTVKYLSASVQASDLYTLLATAGYDNAELRAKQATYDALSQECKYTRDPDTE
jgi:hypothetical protein